VVLQAALRPRVVLLRAAVKAVAWVPDVA